MPAMDVTSCRGDPIQESMMQLCPFWTCNIVRFGLATLYIYILQQTLTELDAGDIWKGLKGKIESGEELSDEDMMRMIIYPLTFRGRRAKQEAVARAIGLAKRIADGKPVKAIINSMLTAHPV